MSFRITFAGGQLTVEDHAGQRPAVTISTLDHSLLVEGPDATTQLYGATRGGLDALLQDVGRATATTTDATDVQLRNAVHNLLRQNANRSGKRRAAVDRDVFRLHPTPLVFARPFLYSRYLADDAERFWPCRVALARAEEDLPGRRDVEFEAALVETLAGWRRLYTRAGAKKKAINRSLAEFGETASADALWGLTRTALPQKVPSKLHLEVIGALGVIYPDPAHTLPIIERLLGETPRALGEAVVDIDERRLGLRGLHPVHRLAHLVGLARPEGKVAVATLVKQGLEGWFGLLGLEAPMVKPPIPLPKVRAIRFIDNLGGLIQEGDTMQHCVARYHLFGLSGTSYFFHIDGPGGGATAEVTHEGRVLEVQGPQNRRNTTVPRAVRHLRRWARGLWVNGLDKTQPVAPPGFVAPRGHRVLRTWEDAYAAYAAVCRVRPDDDGALCMWFRRQCQLAQSGHRQALVQSRGLDQQHEVWLVDRYGRRLEHALKAPVPGRLLTDWIEWDRAA